MWGLSFSTQPLLTEFGFDVLRILRPRLLLSQVVNQWFHPNRGKLRRSQVAFLLPLLSSELLQWVSLREDFITVPTPSFRPGLRICQKEKQIVKQLLISSRKSFCYKEWSSSLKILTRRLEIVVKGISEHFQEAGYTVGLLVCRRKSEKHRALLMSKHKSNTDFRNDCFKGTCIWVDCL